MNTAITCFAGGVCFAVAVVHFSVMVPLRTELDGLRVELHARELDANKMMFRAIDAGVAYYDPTTGAFTWKEIRRAE